RHDTYLVFPAAASATVNTVTEERHRSLFKVPVFQADINFESDFDLAGVPAAAPAGVELDWDRAEILVGVSNARGALADPVMTVEGKALTLASAGTSPEL